MHLEISGDHFYEEDGDFGGFSDVDFQNDFFFDQDGSYFPLCE